ncbi:MAG: hypothetical protein JWP81_2833 [Ferruginibacter sp.]|nr:hypothetical protein [Ferruginibacter sp.]
MSKFIPLSLSLLFISMVAFSQENPAITKECSISTGLGFAAAPSNAKAMGRAFWLQMDYRVMEHFSIAFEVENFAYVQGGYFPDLPKEYPNEINVLNNNFSLLIKYHVASKGKLKFAFASGWTYSIRNETYYIPSDNSQIWFANVRSSDDYRIPFLLEVQYPVSKTINVLARAKYNMNPKEGDNYSAGIGLSLKL